jgi:hypothetical protein
MNKLFTKITSLALGAAMMVGVGVTFGTGPKGVNFAEAASGDKYTFSATSGTSTDKNWSYTTAKNSGSTNPAWNSGSSELRLYPKNSITFTAKTGYTLTSASFTNKFNKSSGVTISSWKASAGTITTFSNTLTSFSVTEINASSLTITVDGTKGNIGLKTVTMTYTSPATTQTITVDPASGEAYTDENISLTTNAASANWALSNNTCGASLSAASGKTVTVSATGAGSVRVTATASGYTSPYVDLTFSKRPTSPYITPEKSSTSGYTGQNETISFSYGNLTGSLSVSSSNTSVVTVGSPSYDAGEGTVQFNFVGAGSTTVKFYDGSTELASVNVSVTASSVSITGLAASDSVYVGKTLDLGSTITVTATGSYSNAVSWSSDDTSIATVTSAGVVTGVKEGSTTITVASVDYPSATSTCTVTVSEVVSYELVTDVSKLADGTQFVLVDYVSSTYRIAKDLNSGHIKMNTVTSKTDISGTSSGDTVVTEEADIFTLVGSAGSWEIKRGDTYLQFTGTSNGNDSFTDTSSADTKFSISASSTANKVTIASNSRTNRVLRYNTSTGDLRNYGNTGSQPDLYMYAIIPAQNKLDSISISGQTASFDSGVTFSFGGTVTAHYTLEADANVTNSATFHLDSESGSNMSGVTLTHAAHDGHTIYVKYTENDITKTVTYTISVANAPVESVSINVNAAEIGLNEEYSVSGITVTVSPSDAIQTYVWTDVSNTVGNDYVFEGTELLSGNTAGTITLRCSSTADSTKYADLVVTVTADPTAEFTPASVSGYVGKSDDIAFIYGNMSDTSLISITSSNSSIVEVDKFVADAGEGLVTVNFVADGSATLSISYNGGSALDTVDVTVSADSVTALVWSAPKIKVYSGATTTVSDAGSWNVHYTMASGDYGSLVYGEYTLKLGGSSIALPHTWDASEDGKVLSIEYGGFVSPTTSTVDVTQSLQAVKAPVEGDPVTKTWNATSGCLGDAIGTVGNTATGSLTFDDESTMSYTRTLEYLASGKADYVSFSSPYQQFGSKNALNTLVLEASNSNKVTEVVVTCWAKDGATDVSVTVGGNAFDVSKSAPSSAGSLAFSGSASGNIVITMEKAAKTAGCAQYIASVAITTVESSGETKNIANVAGHEPAQKAVVAFAKAMNAAFDNTENCTDGVAAAWATASSAYSSNITNNASLSAEEKAYAKNLIKYASAQYTDDTDNDYSYCLERAMATYEACIQKHGQTGFMSDVRSVSPSSRITPLSLFNDGNSNTVAIIVVISIISITCIGGFFFLRKRKEI